MEAVSFYFFFKKIKDLADPEASGEVAPNSKYLNPYTFKEK